MTNEQVASNAAAAIRKYWAERGFTVKVSVKRVDGDDHGIRSDMIDGLPREMKGRK